MNRDKVYKTPQFAVAVIGLWLLVVGAILWFDDNVSQTEVQGAKDFTPRVIQGDPNLQQSAGSLQGGAPLQQSGGGLQTPAQSLQKTAEVNE